MKEKLIIKNFGPIKSVELDLGRFNILIGEQATGKSTVAKVLAVCRYFSYIIGAKGGIRHLYVKGTFEEGLEAWGLKDYLTGSSFISYDCSDYTLVVENEKIPTILTESNLVHSSVLRFNPKLTSKTQRFDNLLKELEKIKPSFSDPLDVVVSNSWRIPTSFFINDVKNVMENPFYLPTERGLQSIFSIGQGSIPNLANFLFNYYSKVDGILQSFKTETEIEPLDILYVNRNGIGYIRKKHEKQFHLLANAASGYQSTIPIVLVMKYYNDKQKKPKTFLIEEEELNLFPSAQDKVMKYVVEQANKYKNSILITTQSPYILTSVNNMMYAYQVGQIHPEQVSKEIDKKYWLNPEDVSAYMLKSDGTYEDIFDREEGMIQADKIDGVSSEINKKFDKLLHIEFKKDELNT